MDDAKLVQRARLAAAFLELPAQGKRLVGVLPGLLVASLQPTDVAKPGDPGGLTFQLTCAATVADPLLQQRSPSDQPA